MAKRLSESESVVGWNRRSSYNPSKQKNIHLFVTGDLFCMQRLSLDSNATAITANDLLHTGKRLVDTTELLPARGGLATSINQQGTAVLTTKVAIRKDPIIRDPRGGCLECRPIRNIRTTGVSKTSTLCRIKIDHTKRSHQQLLAATPIMRAIRPILQVAITARLSDSLPRNAPSNPKTTMGLALTKPNQPSPRALRLVFLMAAVTRGTRSMPHLELNSSNSQPQLYHGRMSLPC